MTKFRVEWTVSGFGDNIHFLDYDSLEEAQEHAKDIAGFMGVVLLGIREVEEVIK